MRVRVCLSILLIIGPALAGCKGYGFAVAVPEVLTAERRAAVEDGVRRFATIVSHDVTQDGPVAWLKYFSDQPEFFMAVNGTLAFPSGQAAAQAIPGIARVYRHIELHWGDGLRVDVLAPDLAVMAAPYTEVIEYADGHRETVSGYFTGVTELRNGAWRFRDAHWSAPVMVAKTP
jgi:hypothetical protein